MEPFVLTSDRVRLSVPTTSDIDRIAECCTDPDIQTWTTVPKPYTRESARFFVEEMVPQGWEKGAQFNWAIRAPGDCDSPVLGMAGISVSGERDGMKSAEIGWWMAPDARGQGLLNGACQLILGWAFSEESGLGLCRATWHAVVGNWPSRRAAWRLGFVVEGTLRRHYADPSGPLDAWVATLLPEDPRSPNEPWPADAPDPIVALPTGFPGGVYPDYEALAALN